MPEIIDAFVRDIPEARSGFRLIFSGSPFRVYLAAFHHIRDDMVGSCYRSEEGGP